MEGKRPIEGELGSVGTVRATGLLGRTGMVGRGGGGALGESIPAVCAVGERTVDEGGPDWMNELQRLMTQ